MICYKDRCYCDFYKTCNKGQSCNRAATAKLINDANDFGLPVAYYTDKPDCFELSVLTMEEKIFFSGGIQ